MGVRNPIGREEGYAAGDKHLKIAGRRLARAVEMLGGTRRRQKFILTTTIEMSGKGSEK